MEHTTKSFTAGLVVGNTLALAIFCTWVTLIFQGFKATFSEYLFSVVVIVACYGVVAFTRRKLEWF